MQYPSLRIALAAEVIAAAMPDHAYPLTDQQVLDTYNELTTCTTVRGAVLNTSIHALITHDRYHRGHQLTQAPDAATFRRITERAITLGEACKATWNGWEYAWDYHALMLTRFIESVCTYYEPSPV